MKKEKLNKEKFLKIIEKFLDNECTKEEEALIINFYESFQKDQEWHEEYGIEKEVKEIIHLRILNSISESELPQRKTRKLKLIWRYAAAASVTVLLATSLFLNFKNEMLGKQPISVKNDIKIGTNKGILTLQNGEQVLLEKGKEYNSQTANSNGEQLIYAENTDNQKSTSKEIAYNVLTIPRGGEFFIQLEDNTKVWLNSESQLKYPVAFTDGQLRKVELVYGEAYFDVSHSTEHKGSKFKVFTKNQEIEVLGTEFNINAYKDESDIYTTLVEGKIAVANGKSNTILNPNQQSIIKDNIEGIYVVEADLFTATSWRKGIFSFENLSLEKIMQTLSRWYDVEVEFSNPKIKEENFTGVLRKNQNIEEILKIIKTMNNISYEIDNKKIILK
ncbi:FecR family protein [Lutibacter oceani]|uniref:FecR family protein n=1 Tax=Lutibacter oceani TaxID=1853311 RepID=A0A3D9S2D0_9FLAO|nr:FecR family protein [Lutibacter oceani]REE83015.1 FecR family protein [Lutibacter oceani]